jgi:hypothetical protein
MRNKFILQAGLFLYGITSVCALESLHTTIPDASIVGRGTLTYAFWDIYDATLYAPQGKWDRNKPFALSIHYKWPLEGKSIADRSVQEMRKQGFQDEVKLATWTAQMKSIFPDVGQGTVLTAIHAPGAKTVFYHDNKLIGSIKGDEFGRYFFDIWLSEKTSAPDLRRNLLGQQ